MIQGAQKEGIIAYYVFICDTRCPIGRTISNLIMHVKFYNEVKKKLKSKLYFGTNINLFKFCIVYFMNKKIVQTRFKIFSVLYVYIVALFIYIYICKIHAYGDI